MVMGERLVRVEEYLHLRPAHSPDTLRSPPRRALFAPTRDYDAGHAA